MDAFDEFDDVGETLNVKQVSTRLRVTQDTIRRWCKREGLPHTKLPGTKGEFRFVWKDVVHWYKNLGRR